MTYKPSRPITQSGDPDWRYVHSSMSDIRKTFREWQRKQKAQQPEQPKVVQIKKGAK